MTIEVGSLVAFEGRRDYMVVDQIGKLVVLSNGHTTFPMDPREVTVVMSRSQLAKEFGDKYPFE